MMSSTVSTYLADFSLDGQGDFLSKGTRSIVDEVVVEGLTIPRFTNEFWTAGQRGGHSLHEVSYRACFKAELPRFFINLLTEEGQRVYDPFMGRGTTLLEAALLGRRVAGNDVNPLSRILLGPRLAPPNLDDVEKRLDEIDWDVSGEADIDLSMFYSKATLRQLMALRGYLLARAGEGNDDDVDRWIRMVATNRLTGHSSGFFSVYSMPPNQAVLPDRQIKINAKRNQAPPDRDARAIILKKSRALQKEMGAETCRRLNAISRTAQLLCGDARMTDALEDNSVDLVVTSPPFLDVVNYASDNWLRCWFNGFDAKEIDAGITTTRRLDEWSDVMGDVLRELRRVLTPGGWIAFEVGEVRGGKVRLDEVIAPLGVRAGLQCHGIVINQQAFTKTANCWGVKNNAKGTNTNRIVLFEKARNIHSRTNSDTELYVPTHSTC